MKIPLRSQGERPKLRPSRQIRVDSSIKFKTQWTESSLRRRPSDCTSKALKPIQGLHPNVSKPGNPGSARNGQCHDFPGTRCEILVFRQVTITQSSHGESTTHCWFPDRCEGNCAQKEKGDRAVALLIKHQAKVA